MTVEITRLTIARSEALPYRASVITRDDGKLVGVRLLRAVTEAELERKIGQLRGVNARDDLATNESGPPAEAGRAGAPKG